jgi:FixJ family two-component response regulator
VRAVGGSPKAAARAKVFVVEDDASMRDALSSLIRSVDLDVETFASATDFLRCERADVPACAVLDVRLPGVSGLDLQGELARVDDPIPIVFITAHADVPMCARAMKAGAVEFLAKPFRDQDLLEAIQHAIRRGSEALVRRSELAELRRRYERLTPREREVMRLIARGLLNKQVAAELGTREQTVKIQRGQVMQKMQAESIVELARMADRIGLSG